MNFLNSYREVMQQPAWGMFGGPEEFKPGRTDLLAAVRAPTQEQAIKLFETLPGWARGNIEPSRRNVKEIEPALPK